MRIVAISDTHSLHDQIIMPDGDILIHAGDCTLDGKIVEAESFLKWFSGQPHATKIFVPGNHDEPFAEPRVLGWLRKTFPTVNILIDQELYHNGMRIYGVPWLPGIASEPEHFWIRANSTPLREKWDAIPDDTALLITHGPPYNILDKNESGQYIGDPLLAHRLHDLKDLRLHIFGHVHRSYGTIETNDRLYVNAATCDSEYRSSHPPIIIDWNHGDPKVTERL